MKKQTFSTEVDGKALEAEFSDLALHADGSVLVRYGDTSVLATAVMSHKKEDRPYFPLSVEYEEKFYAAGQILGSQYMRREGRPSDEAILSGRAVDRTIRPLFDHRIRNSVQIVITVLSIGEDDPDVPAIIAASLALSTSDIPWNGPVGAVRIGKNDDWHTNPTFEIRNEAELDLLACGKDGLINMIEVGGKEVSESDVSEALKKASELITKLEKFQKDIVKEIGKEKRELDLPEANNELKNAFESEVAPKLEDAVFTENSKQATANLRDEWNEYAYENLDEEQATLSSDYFEERVDEIMHKKILEEDKRPDGRALDEIRPLYAQAGDIAPKVHGVGVFYRGGTHILSALTLGGPGDSLVVDSMEIQMKKRFIHHYNFPPFSVGETGRVGGFNRRMIGHGALAEKAVLAVLPDQKEFPYTIRIVSEAFSSNGSTSMGSVCGSTLALMDAGVPISSPVAGIAIGLVTDAGGKYKILTDIQGPEDHYGDMDLKVAGTRKGITAMQMDVKVEGTTLEILTEALDAAQKARLQILDVITGAISEPRPELPAHAPHIVVVMIDPDQIGHLIGSGGKTINTIKDATGTEIDIEEDGSVYITGDKEGTTKAKKFVEEITHEYKKGERFEGVVTRVADFGAFVKIAGAEELGEQHNTEGLVHISEIAPFRIDSVEGVLSVGDSVPVVVKEVDERGRINLSIKEADPNFAKEHGATKETKQSGDKSSGNGESNSPS